VAKATYLCSANLVSNSAGRIYATHVSHWWG